MRSDPTERQKLSLMRRARSESVATHSIGGRKYQKKRKPSLAKMPWDNDAARRQQPAEK